MAATSSTSRCRLPGGWASSSAHELVEVVPTAGRRRCPGMLSPQMSPSRCAGTAPLHRRWLCSLRLAVARTCFPRPVAARTRIYTLRPHPHPVRAHARLESEQASVPLVARCCIPHRAADGNGIPGTARPHPFSQELCCHPNVHQILLVPSKSMCVYFLQAIKVCIQLISMQFLILDIHFNCFSPTEQIDPG
jgi:hypothetical protein